VNAYQYNGKELNSDFGLDWLDYGARWYDASIARWSAVDPLAEKFVNQSPYDYVFNNPLSWTDPDGRAPALYTNFSAGKSAEMADKLAAGMEELYQVREEKKNEVIDIPHGNDCEPNYYASASPNDWYLPDGSDKPVWIDGSAEIDGYLHLSTRVVEVTPEQQGVFAMSSSSAGGVSIDKIATLLNSGNQSVLDVVRGLSASSDLKAAIYHSAVSQGKAEAAEYGALIAMFVLDFLTVGETAIAFEALHGMVMARRGGNYAYRSLTSANAESLAIGKGIFAKAPNGSWTLEQHLIHGSSPKSFLNNPWIASSTDINVARSFSSGNGLVRIDLSKISANSMQRGWMNLPRSSAGYHYSIWQQEVSIFGHIPQNAIKIIK
jgi:RHS repeat-associated protein